MADTAQYMDNTTFIELPSSVGASFIAKHAELKEWLTKYKLDAYFLKDGTWGKSVICAYLESFGFEAFTQLDQQHGGKYFAFCELFKVFQIDLLSIISIKYAVESIIMNNTL